jgi:hypothetical protein
MGLEFGYTDLKYLFIAGVEYSKCVQQLDNSEKSGLSTKWFWDSNTKTSD